MASQAPASPQASSNEVNPFAQIALGVIFISLIAIYLVTNQDPLVTGISVILLAISLFVAVTSGSQGVRALGLIAIIVSVVAASLLGRQRFGTTGGIIVAAIWSLVLIGLFM